MPKIKVDADGRTFTTSSGNPFVPFGVTYFRPRTGWAPQVWKKFDAAAIRADFAKLKAMGGNTARVFLSYGSFLEVPGKLNEEGLSKFDEFLRIAEEQGIYVHPTGPDHWEGLPDWARDRFTDDAALKAVEDFWQKFATRYRGRNVIFAYDLLNEPEIPRDSADMRPKWGAWVRKKYGSVAAAARAWEVAPDSVSWEAPSVPSFDKPGNALLDYQHFREDLAEQWVKRQAQVIHATDPHALVTVGLIQWAVPLSLAATWHYSGTRPARLAPYLDFVEFHFYPFANGFYEYGGPEEETKNLSYLECVAREMAKFRKPVVLAEFAWYGGGKPSLDGGKHPAATEEQQARWCRQVVETTAGQVTGWLNWGFYDSPEATDPSELSGLLTADGKTKAWGQQFESLARELGGKRLRTPRALNRPDLDWDKLIIDMKAQAAFREEYLRAFKLDASPAK